LRQTADAALWQTVLPDLPRNQEGLRDLDLLLRRVAGQLDHLHAVAQRAGNRVEQVRRGDEEHAREVEGHVQVVVAEARVLLRVEHLEQGGGGVAAEVGPELVDLVQHEHGVVGARLLQPLDDAPGKRPHVGAPVTANLGLVADAAQ
jgi:hypothetical protein